MERFHFETKLFLKLNFTLKVKFSIKNNLVSKWFQTFIFRQKTRFNFKKSKNKQQNALNRWKSYFCLTFDPICNIMPCNFIYLYFSFTRILFIEMNSKLIFYVNYSNYQLNRTWPYEKAFIYYPRENLQCNANFWR